MRTLTFTLVLALIASVAQAQAYWYVEGTITSETGIMPSWMGPTGSFFSTSYDWFTPDLHAPSGDGYSGNGTYFTDIWSPDMTGDGSASLHFLTISAANPVPSAAGVGTMVIGNAQYGSLPAWNSVVPSFKTVAAPEIPPSGWATSLTFLGMCLAVLRGRRRA
jgi:hypothetical protein